LFSAIAAPLIVRLVAPNGWVEAARPERTLPALISSVANALRSEHRQLPRVGSFVVTDEICVTVCACEFEISIVGREPSVDHLRDGDATVTENQRAWRLLAPMAGVALDTNAENASSRHSIIIRP
jgi:hypothetical protein